MVSPRPVPPNLRVVEPSACANRFKYQGVFFGGNTDPGVADFESQAYPLSRRWYPRLTLTAIHPGR